MNPRGRYRRTGGHGGREKDASESNSNNDSGSDACQCRSYQDLDNKKNESGPYSSHKIRT